MHEQDIGCRLVLACFILNNVFYYRRKHLYIVLMKEVATASCQWLRILFQFNHPRKCL